MTIKEYLENLPTMTAGDGTTLKEELYNTTHIWSNDTCRGYCIHAMQEAGLPMETIKRVNRELTAAFDALTEAEADDVYRTFFYDV